LLVSLLKRLKDNAGQMHMPRILVSKIKDADLSIFLSRLLNCALAPLYYPSAGLYRGRRVNLNSGIRIIAFLTQKFIPSTLYSVIRSRRK